MTRSITLADGPVGLAPLRIFRREADCAGARQAAVGVDLRSLLGRLLRRLVRKNGLAQHFPVLGELGDAQ